MLGRLVHQGRVLREVDILDDPGTDDEPLGDLLDRLRNLVKGGAQDLDVLPLQLGDERVDQSLVDLSGDPAVGLLRRVELVQARGLARGLKEPVECLDAVTRLLGACLQEGKKNGRPCRGASAGKS